MRRVSSGRSRGSSGGGFRGSRGSFGSSSRSSSGSFLGSSRHRSYGVGRYRLWNSLPTWGKVIYVIVILIIVIAYNFY